uniref:Uncharacterized protein n=1 Tax=Picea sitchensis TaxID=3332 RepID=A9NW36_PICSI|nr:unknown [Picea sitchensis]
MWLSAMEFHVKTRIKQRLNLIGAQQQQRLQGSSKMRSSQLKLRLLILKLEMRSP